MDIYKSAENIVIELCKFPHRATGTKFDLKAFEYLLALLKDHNPKLEHFKSHKTYLITISWIIMGLMLGLILLNIWPIIGLAIVVFFTTFGFRFFNWQSNPISDFPPKIKTQNLVVKDQNPKAVKLILMAHIDTAPISALYLPKMVGNFQKSLKINMLLLIITQLIAVFYFIAPNDFTQYCIWFICVYLMIQLVIASIDFLRFGYSNGASDNATGVAAAITTAKNLWNEKLKNIEVELLITGAEEVGMIGAKKYLKNHYQEFNKNTMVINFDTLGAGNLKIINQTGSWSKIKYDNILTKTALDLCKDKLSHVETGQWNTADFDTVWFNKVGIPSVTLAALDHTGKMPNIHRETDVLANIDYKPMYDAIDLATLMVENLDKIKF